VATKIQRRRATPRAERSETPGEGPPNPDDLIPSQRERRARIVRVALRMLERGEYEDIQMRDVAERAEVALGTVYRYFGSKEHLFAAVLVEWSDSLQNRVQRQPLVGDDVPAQLVDLVERVIDAFERLPQFFRLMIVIETTTDPYARALYEEFNGHTHLTFAQPLERLEPGDADAVLHVLMAVLGGVMRAWAMGHMTTDEIRQRLRETIRLVFSPAPKVKGRARKAAAVRATADASVANIA
jgi:AcrR family transcriptional regulator